LWDLGFASGGKKEQKTHPPYRFPLNDGCPLGKMTKIYKNHLQHSQDDRGARRVTSWGSKVASTPHICPMTTAHMDDITALGVMCFSWKPAMECDSL
jgi:hypothetical protein